MRRVPLRELKGEKRRNTLEKEGREGGG